MNRRLVIAFACVAVALGGCATSWGTSDHGASTEGSASAPTTSPRSQPADDFGSSAPHNFGSQGP